MTKKQAPTNDPKFWGNPPPPYRYSAPELNIVTTGKTIQHPDPPEPSSVEDAPPVYSDNQPDPIVMHLKDEYAVKIEYAPILHIESGTAVFHPKKSKANVKLSICKGKIETDDIAYLSRKTAGGKVIESLRDLFISGESTWLVNFLNSFVLEQRKKGDWLDILEISGIEHLAKAITDITASNGNILVVTPMPSCTR